MLPLGCDCWSVFDCPTFCPIFYFTKCHDTGLQLVIFYFILLFCSLDCETTRFLKSDTRRLLIQKECPIWLCRIGSTFEVFSIEQKWITGLKKKKLLGRHWQHTPGHILSASCFEVTFIALHSSYCHSLLSPCSHQAWGHRLDITPLGGSCWPSLLMLSAIHDKRYEMGTWWL